MKSEHKGKQRHIRGRVTKDMFSNQVRTKKN